LCTHILTEEGEIELSQSYKSNIFEKIETKILEEGNIAIACAYKIMNEAEFTPNEKCMEQNLILCGIFSIEDPIRPDMATLIGHLKESCIQVKMLTGEETSGALFTANACGIIEKQNTSSIETGEGFNNNYGPIIYRPINENKKIPTLRFQDKFISNLKRIKVIAEATYDHKLMLSIGCKSIKKKVVGSIVQYTTDNDVSKIVDISIALSQSSTEDIKATSSIIINEPSDIYMAIKQSRNIYFTIRKFIQFQLTASFSTSIAILIYAVFNGRSPLSLFQLLWIDIIIDTLATLALNGENAKNCIMKGKPFTNSDRIMNQEVWKYITMHTIGQAGCLLYMLLYGNIPSFSQQKILEFDKMKNEKDTMIFHTLVLMQLFNLITCRASKTKCMSGICRNCSFLVIWFLVLIIEYSLITFLKDLSSAVALSLTQHIECLTMAVISALIGAISFCIPAACFKFNIEQGDSQESNPYSLYTALRKVDSLIPSEKEKAS
jgi:magnesium-transporting ATPase (P-type)